MRKFRGTKQRVPIVCLFLTFILIWSINAMAQNPSWVAPIIKWDANGGATITVFDPGTYLPGVKPANATCFTCHNGGRQPDSPGYAGTEDEPMPAGPQTSPFDGNGYFISGHGNVLRKVMPLVSSVPLVAGSGAPAVAPSPGGLGTIAGSWGFIPLSSCTTATQATDCAAYRGTSNWRTGTSLRGLAASWSQIGDASCVVYTSHTVTNTGCSFPISGTLSAPIQGITAPWADHNGTPYAALDPYGSLSLFNLNAGTVNVAGSGTIANLYYIFGGWTDTNQLDSIFNGGLTGEQWGINNYDCARCHTTGYRFDALGTEPTTISSPTVAWSDINGPTFNFTYSAQIPDAQFSRAPSNGACSANTDTVIYANYADCVAVGGTWPTSSWYATGIQCSRCHGNNYCTGAATKSGTEPPPGLDATNTPQCGWVDTVKDSNGLFVVRPARPYQPINQQATALCMECHRTEVVTPPPPGQMLGTINPAPVLGPGLVGDGGSCSDGVSDYASCVAPYTWNYAPSIDHEAGLTFLNSPHARYSGTVTQNKQNSVDLSLVFNGSYNSHFTDWGEGMTVDESAWNSALPVSSPPNGTGPKPLANGGCVGCHNPHDSVNTFASAKLAAPGGIPATPAYSQPDAFAMPAGKKCTDCHTRTDQMLSSTMKHPTGPGTPFPDGIQASGNFQACVACHMQAANGLPTNHYMRISADANYYTFPTAAQFYAGQTAPNTISASDGYPEVWQDVDIACGQCHGGGNSSTNGVWQNPYGITAPSPAPPAFSRAYLAMAATGMHNTDYRTPTAALPTFSLAAGTYAIRQNVYLSDTTVGATIFYTTDGTTPTTASTAYVPGAAIPVATTTTINAIAGGAGFTSSAVASATYNIVPIPAAPTFSPGAGVYNGTQTVGLATSTPNTGTTFYYTTNGTTPTTSSAACAAPCTVSVAASQTLNAIAVYTSGSISQAGKVGSAVYRILPAPAPTFSPAPYPTIYTAATSVTLSDAVAGVTICYTTNGTTPVVGATAGTCAVGAAYTTPIALNRYTNTSIKAVAGGPGFVSSPIVSALYVIR